MEQKLKSIRDYARVSGHEGLTKSLEKVKEYNKNHKNDRIIGSKSLKSQMKSGNIRLLANVDKEHKKAKAEKKRERIAKGIKSVNPSATIPRDLKKLNEKAKLHREIAKFYDEQTSYNASVKGRHSKKLGFNPKNEKELKAAKDILKQAKAGNYEKVKEILKVKGNDTIYNKSRNKYKKSSAFRDYTYLKTLKREGGEFAELFERGGLSMADELHGFDFTILDLIDSGKAVRKSTETLYAILETNLNKFSASNAIIVKEFLESKGLKIDED